MERPPPAANFAENGGMKLPIGYRFHPTDEELVVHYLRRKVFGIPLPASVIPEVDVFQADPWSLPGDLKEKRYFFSRRKGSDDNNENNGRRAAGSGHWKPIGKGRLIVSSATNQVVGIRKRLVFSEGKHSSSKTKTKWVMHEYSLLGSATLMFSNQVTKMSMGDWAVYRVFQKKMRPKRHGVSSQSSSINNAQAFEMMNKPSFIDFSMEENSDIQAAGSPPQPPSPCSSGITDEVSCNGLLDEEEINSLHSFTSFSCMMRRNT